MRVAPAASAAVGRLRLAPDAFLERFGAGGVLLLADRDRWLQVNAAFAGLFEDLGRSFGVRPFTPAEVASLLARRYCLAPRAAARRANAVLREWATLGVLLPSTEERP